MPSLSDVLASVDGLRSDTAKRLEAQFPTVAALSAANREDLEEIKGVGQVMSGRLLMAAARAQATMSDPEAATKSVKDSTAATMAVATEVIDAAGKVAGKVAGRSESASQLVRDAEIAAKTGVYRLHASSDEAIDRTAEAVGPAAATAKAVADKAVGTAKDAAGKVVGAASQVGKAATAPARKAMKGKGTAGKARPAGSGGQGTGGDEPDADTADADVRGDDG